MAVTQQVSQLAQKLGKRIAEAHLKFKDAPVDTGRVQLPAGINRGTAKLSACYIKAYTAEDAAKAPKTVAAPAPQELPELTAWKSSNSWFGPDPVKTGAAMGLAREAHSKGLAGKPYFDHIDAGMKKLFEPPPPATSKTEDGGPAGSGRVPLPQDDVVFDAGSFSGEGTRTRRVA